MESNEFSDRKQEPAQTPGLVRRETPDDGKIPEKRKLNWGLLAPVIAVVAAFALGLVPMWLKAARHASERDSAHRQIKILQLETLIAGAAIDARRAEYEPARQSASQFFTLLAEEVNSPAAQSSLKPEQQPKLQPLLNERDDLITLLARSDPASAERLAGVYLNFRKALGEQTTAPTAETARTPNEPPE